MRLADVRNVDESSFLTHESVPFLDGGEYCNRHMLHHDAAQMKNQPPPAGVLELIKRQLKNTSNQCQV